MTFACVRTCGRAPVHTIMMHGTGRTVMHAEELSESDTAEPVVHLVRVDQAQHGLLAADALRGDEPVSRRRTREHVCA